jgi:hypothetical protein
MAIDYTKPPRTPRGAPAISLEKVRATAPALVDLYQTAGVSLEKSGLSGQRAAVYLVLDRSRSMRRHYRDGTMQHLAEQVLGLAAHFDDDGTVPVVFFSTHVDGQVDIGLHAYQGRINALYESFGRMGQTNYRVAMEGVIDHYTSSGTRAPAFVIFQTDGGPTSRKAAEQVLCDASTLPIFWQFIGFGDPHGKHFDFLRKLDELPVPAKRMVDNAGFFPAGSQPREIPDAVLYAELTREFPQWLRAARAAGILR